uniref:Uncharacterized protein n=1 Tax=Tetradesmus obliquus TaxID=3088 RepID=A0A383VJ96_TETOB|eukprot:jgi/Sobl393_1/2352/SZX64734.1
MKAISVCLLALMVAAAAAARPGLAGRALRADSNEENKQGSSESFLLPMPAIYIPEFGKEMTFNDVPKFPDMADTFPKVPEMPSITPPTIDWDKIKPSSDNHPSVSVPDANSQEVNTQSSQDSTTDNNYKKDESDNSDKSDKTGKKEKLGAGNSTPATKQQESQQPTAAPSTTGNQDDCSKTDTSAQSVMRCVNAVRTNPQAFKSDFPCSSPWLNTISRSQRSALAANSKLESSAQRQANDMARY